MKGSHTCKAGHATSFPSAIPPNNPIDLSQALSAASPPHRHPLALYRPTLIMAIGLL